MKKSIITILILLLFPLQVFAYSNYIIPGGTNIGIEVYNKGIMVIGFYKIDNKYIREVITIKLSSAVLNHIRLKHPPPLSYSYEQEISRYFHRPHLPPSSAMLMEKRLIF